MTWVVDISWWGIPLLWRPRLARGMGQVPCALLACLACFQRCLAPTPSDIHFPDNGYFLIAVLNVWNVRDLGETVLIAAVWGTSGSPVAGLAETTGRNVWSSPAPFQTL